MHGQQLLQEIEILPPELQKQVSDFVIFLRTQQQKQTLKKRTVGEYKGKIVIQDDFNEPLADDFWLGEAEFLGQYPTIRNKNSIKKNNTAAFIEQFSCSITEFSEIDALPLSERDAL